MLYHYYKCTDYAVDAIKENRLYFANPWTFNDPLERVIMFDRRRDEEGNSVAIERVHYAPRGMRGLDVGVFCFCTSMTNYLLWSHYADGHKGVCIGFDFDRLMRLDPFMPETRHLELSGASAYVRNVVYEPVFFELPYMEKPNDEYWSLNPEETMRAFTHKIAAWGCEDEVRRWS